MVQFFQGLPSQKGILSETLGKGLANFTTSYFADKSLQKVVNDPNLKKASLSERYNALESALRPYGEQGQNILQSRLQSELRREQEQELKKQETRQKTVGPIFGKISRGEDITPEEESMLTPQELKDVHTVRAAYERANKPKAPLASEQPITPEQLKLMQQVRNEPGFDELNEVEQYRKYIDSGVSPINAERESKLTSGISERKRAEQIQFHKEGEKYDEDLFKQTKIAKKQIDTIKDITKSVNSGKVTPLSLANIFKGLGKIGDKISEALINKDEATLLASIPQLLEGWKEIFGVRLSDADLKVLQDKLPSIGKSAEANKAILKILSKYAEMTLLRSTIAREIKELNNGLRPLGYADKIEQRFDEMVVPVKIINPKNGKEIEIPAYKVSDAIKAGAKLANGQ